MKNRHRVFPAVFLPARMQSKSDGEAVQGFCRLRPLPPLPSGAQRCSTGFLALGGAPGRIEQVCDILAAMKHVEDDGFLLVKGVNNHIIPGRMAAQARP